jgi:uncharacterized repeat protein (TIGR03803 family)
MKVMTWRRILFGPKLMVVGLWIATAVSAQPQTFQVVTSLPASLDGTPSSLTQGTNGNLYGTTAGVEFSSNGGVFEYTPLGRLAGFLSLNGTYDANPAAGVTLADDGDFYGTSASGGPGGYGTVFRTTAAGQLTTLASFDATNGWYPAAVLIQGSDGSFYGTTSAGGLLQDCVGDPFSGCGNVFRMTPTGNLTTIHNFDFNDGAFPSSALVEGIDGNLYGTAAFGGRNGGGVVFRITAKGKFTDLYSFCSLSSQCADGFSPNGPMVQGPDGNFYGTTTGGGVNCPQSESCGTVFKITPAGKLTTLYSFCAQSNCADGTDPWGLALATDGNFYGVTSGGGTSSNCGNQGCGTIFQVTATGKLTTLYNFCVEANCPDGMGALVSLLQATDGTFYGTTAFGGAYGDGTIFSLSMGLVPFVKTVPVSGRVGRKVIILGNYLTDTSSVTFSGTPAEFEVVSATTIVSEVPAGATTGTVQVNTPSGVLSSNIPFHVF